MVKNACEGCRMRRMQMVENADGEEGRWWRIKKVKNADGRECRW